MTSKYIALDGGMAMEAFTEGIHPDTTSERKTRTQQQLLAYCKLDTYARVCLWQVFSGRTGLNLCLMLKHPGYLMNKLLNKM
ncbi:hypothetical protein [Nitrosomonas ureae]|uniref:Uncharacterized protein n=1 Tax=Nitrosomonas ureae TaxID=44577 RepID=A0A1H2DP31_9PROT|nr:hypothetical protein [Nitrosomonas ureae]ALQ49824.1 hypothetical protein ATY38_00345 [Nitrosomonas ureae]SDT84640.1 hypothetical protein SAMN05216406_10252 [Nitrosomonas ureae]